MCINRHMCSIHLSFCWKQTNRQTYYWIYLVLFSWFSRCVFVFICFSTFIKCVFFYWCASSQHFFCIGVSSRRRLLSGLIVRRPSLPSEARKKKYCFLFTDDREWVSFHSLSLLTYSFGIETTVWKKWDHLWKWFQSWLLYAIFYYFSQTKE